MMTRHLFSAVSSNILLIGRNKFQNVNKADGIVRCSQKDAIFDHTLSPGHFPLHLKKNNYIDYKKSL